ncbi:MAG: 3-deoxy-8-phosphooctulonate synthase [Myxococcaceae bacterium]|nr:3-deoxy-8-phosphooctulonate synthase [Myxococcaceae bacterium]
MKTTDHPSAEFPKTFGPHPIGAGAPLVLLCGPDVIEGPEITLRTARAVQEIALRHGVSLIFKCSFDKANRSSIQSFRGPGLEEGLEILAWVKRETSLPIVTDVHETAQVARAAQVADVLQVPAFLCRQTDLLVACARSGRAVNVKKGQFLAPADMRHAVQKIRQSGGRDLLLTERGSTFGYQNLVVDMRSLAIMRALGVPVCFDATHSVQLPGAAGDSTGGDRRFVRPLARAAAAVGVDALFLEVHERPDVALCDGPNSLDFADLDRLLAEVCAIRGALATLPSEVAP